MDNLAKKVHIAANYSNAKKTVNINKVDFFIKDGLFSWVYRKDRETWTSSNGHKIGCDLSISNNEINIGEKIHLKLNLRGLNTIQYVGPKFTDNVSKIQEMITELQAAYNASEGRRATMDFTGWTTGNTEITNIVPPIDIGFKYTQESQIIDVVDFKIFISPALYTWINKKSNRIWVCEEFVIACSTNFNTRFTIQNGKPYLIIGDEPGIIDAHEKFGPEFANHLLAFQTAIIKIGNEFEKAINPDFTGWMTN